MPTRVRCANPSCAKASLIPDGLTGKPVKCPGCGARLEVAPGTDPGPADTHPGGGTRTTSPAQERVGRFVVRAKLGAGAFGTVYRAYDPQLDREVALKVPNPGVLDSPKRVERFLREAKAAANLRHPHVVPVYDAGRDGDRYFIASAFIDGRPLADAVEDEPLAFDRAARLVRELAEALGYAHAEGVVHRDVKPANCMLDGHDRLHLMDFGLAARADDESRLTTDGSVMGTPVYMAPEQAAGRTDEVGPASDQYACGVVLYEVLTGQTPFAGPTPVVIHNQIHTDPDPPSKLRKDVPKDLETICLKAMAKRPADRYADCQALADDCRRWLEGEPIAARRLSPVERLTRWAKKYKTVAALTGALAAALVVGTAVSLGFAAVARVEAARAERAADDAKAEKQRADEKAAAEAVQRKAATAAFEEARRQTKQAETRGEEARQEREVARKERDEKQKQLELTKWALYGSNVGAAHMALQVGRPDLARQAIQRCPQELAGWEYDYVTGKLNATYSVIKKDTRGAILALAFSHYGRLALSNPGDLRSFSLWEPTTGQVLQTVTVPDLMVLRRLAISPDGARIACSGDKWEKGGETTRTLVVAIWDRKTNKVSIMPGTHQPGNGKPGSGHIAFSPNGRYLAACGDSGPVSVWDLPAGTTAKLLSSDATANLDLRFTADGERLLTVGLGSQGLREWQVATGAALPRRDWNLKGDSARGAISPEGNQYAGIGADGADGFSIVPILGRAQTARVDFGSRVARKVVYAQNGQRIAVGCLDGAVFVLDPRTGTITHTLRGHDGMIDDLAFSPDGVRLATSGGGYRPLVGTSAERRCQGGSREG